jgi:succinate dehydrogenase / fumarate reductase iron-sulfur subunit
MTRHVTLRVLRNKAGSAPRYETFSVNVPESANVLDALERAWHEHDRSLTFRHACHHASCGSCGVRIDGVEKLPCVTPVADYPAGATLTVEPLRNFPVVADLAVDAGRLYRGLDALQAPITRPAEALREAAGAELPEGVAGFKRFENCLECGLCLSACPAMATDPHYLGPAALAAAERVMLAAPAEAGPAILRLLDDEHGLWRCHSAFECTEVCPSNVQPAEALMRLRGMVIRAKFRRLLGREKGST